jgi:hypothetical protein
MMCLKLLEKQEQAKRKISRLKEMGEIERPKKDTKSQWNKKLVL